MLNFKIPEISDKTWVDGILKKSGNLSCAYSFGTLYVWAGIFKTKIINLDGFYCAKYFGRNVGYIFPVGDGDIKSVIDKLIADSEDCGHDFRLYELTEKSKNLLEELYPGQFRFEQYRDDFDYIYATENLINLSGRKYHSKRNHISYFKNNNSWSFEPITEENISECRDMNEKWLQENLEKDSDGILRESRAVKAALDNFKDLGFVGGLLRVDGEVVAFTMGEELNDEVFCTHFEKAFADVRGAYPTVNREFAANMLTKYKFINREEDAGDEGLRKAKLSYRPTILLEKSEAVLIR